MLSKQCDGTNSPNQRESNSDMGACEQDLESHDVKVFGTAN
jgi:hypothetical protein